MMRSLAPSCGKHSDPAMASNTANHGALDSFVELNSNVNARPVSEVARHSNVARRFAARPVRCPLKGHFLYQ